MFRSFLAFKLLAGLALLSLALSPPTLAQQAKGKKYALLVGVTDYSHRDLPSLQFTENDVEKLAEILKSKSGFDEVRLLTSTRGKKDRADSPAAGNIRKAMAELIQKKGKNDLVLVALSGHGIQLEVDDPNGKDRARSYGYFCPADADLAGKVEYRTGKSDSLLNMDHLFEDLGNCGAGVKLVLMDACRNELKAQARSLDVKSVKIPEGVAALFSCKPGQRAFEHKKLRHGVFFHRLIEGLKGEAVDRKGRVTWGSLSEYVTESVQAEVPALVGDGAKQTPHEIKNLVGNSPVLAQGGGKDGQPPDVVIEGGGGVIEDEEVARLKVGEARKRKTELLSDILLDLPAVLIARASVPGSKDYDARKGKLAVDVQVKYTRHAYQSYRAQLEARLKKISLATDEASVGSKAADLSRHLTLPGPAVKGQRIGAAKGMTKVIGPDVSKYDGAWCLWVMTAAPRPFRTLWAGYVVDADPGEVLKAIHGDLFLKVDLLDGAGGRITGEEFSLAEDRHGPRWLGAVASRTRTGNLLQEGHGPLMRGAGSVKVTPRGTFNAYVGPMLYPSFTAQEFTFTPQRTYRREYAMTKAEAEKVRSIRCTLVFKKTRPKE